MASTVLSIDEESELDFKINVTGTSSTELPQTWLVFEGEDMDMRFRGHHSEEERGVLTYTVPRLYGRVKDGTYPAHLEVMIEGRFFKLVPFEVELKLPVRVTVEALVRKPRSDLSVRAESIARESAGPVAVRTARKAPTVELPVTPRQHLVESETSSPKRISQLEKADRFSARENLKSPQVQRLSVQDLRNM